MMLFISSIAMVIGVVLIFVVVPEIYNEGIAIGLGILGFLFGVGGVTYLLLLADADAKRKVVKKEAINASCTECCIPTINNVAELKHCVRGCTAFANEFEVTSKEIEENCMWYIHAPQVEKH